MKFKAVLFDLDGTLLNTIEDISDSMNSVLAKNGYPIHDSEAYKYFVGDGMKVLVQRALPKGTYSTQQIDNYLQANKAEYATRWSNKTVLYPGVDGLLDGLADKKVKRAVLSNKPDAFTKQMIEKLMVNWTFYPVFGERQGVPKKPDPAGALEIVQILDVRPEECLYIGDTGVDMKTANAAGMYAVGVLWGFRKKDELLENGARVVVANPEQILELL